MYTVILGTSYIFRKYSVEKSIDFDILEAYFYDVL